MVHMKKSYAIIGTGAIGGYCAVKLQQAGFDVHCLLRSDYSFVHENGLSIIEDNEVISIPVKAYQDIHSMPSCDVILITLKTTENWILKNLLNNLLHADSIVAVLQNGIGIEEELAEFIEPKKIIGGSSHLKVTKISPGTIKHFNFNTLEWAQYYSDDQHHEISASAEAIAHDFKIAGFDSMAFEHLPTIKWKKVASNIASSGLSVVLDASLDELVENLSSFELLKSLTKEVITAAKTCGANIPNNFYDFRLSVFESFRNMKKCYSSMKDDFNAKKPIEIHAIYENAINIAKKHNVSMPLSEMLYLQLLYLDIKK
jgi:2-dehydropantoate 2-reductase